MKNTSMARLAASVCLALALTSCMSPGLVKVKTPADDNEATLQLVKFESRLANRKPDPAYSTEWNNIQTFMRMARFMLKNYTASEQMLAGFAELMSNAETELAVMEGGEEPRFIPGKRTEGYFSDNDNSFQPFVRYIPKAARGKRKLPLIIYLHGYSPSLNIVNWEYLPGDLTQFAEQHDFLIAAPFGRSNTDYQGIGEQDVLNVIAQMKKRYHVDEDRIILSGISMGGTGTWTIGAHYPDLFAGLVVLCGRGDYYSWQKVNPRDLPSYKQNLIDAEFGFSLLPNLKNVPVYCLHGALDDIIPVEQARMMTTSLRRMNKDVTYVEEPKAPHSIYDGAFNRADLQTWLLARRRTMPASFDYMTFHPRYNGCYWVNINGIDRHQPPALLSTRKLAGSVNIKATGISAIDVYAANMPTSMKELPVVNDSKSSIDYHQRTLRPTLRPESSGPVKQAFLEPFYFIYSGSDSNSDALARFKTASSDWSAFAKAPPRQLHEENLQVKDAKEYNLFLFGEPETSHIMTKVLERSPVKITDQAYIVGSKRFPRAGTGLYMVRPSPWNPDKLIVIQSGIAWGANLPVNHKYDFIPDFIVYSEQTDPDGSNTALCAGFFDEKWEIIPERLYINPKLEPRTSP